MKKNIILLYIYSILVKRVYLPIITIYYLSRELDYTQIGIIVGVTTAISLALDIYGGIFADINSKKGALVLHALFGALASLLLFLGNSFEWFLLAGIFYGVAGAFITGTRRSLLYATLEKLNKTGLFKKYRGRMHLYSHSFNAFLLLLIPVVYKQSPKLPFFISFTFFLGSAIIAWLMVDPSNSIGKKLSLTAGYYVMLKQTVKLIRKSKKMSFAVLLTLNGAFIFLAATYFQPLLKIAGLNVIYFGVVYFAMRILMGWGGEMLHRLEKKFSLRILTIVGLVSALSCFCVFSFGGSLFLILAIVILELLHGFNRLIYDDQVSKNISQSNRTTALSISNFLTSIFSMIFAFLLGIVADRFGVQDMFLFLTVIFAVFIGFIVLRIVVDKELLT